MKKSLVILILLIFVITGCETSPNIKSATKDISVPLEVTERLSEDSTIVLDKTIIESDGQLYVITKNQKNNQLKVESVIDNSNDESTTLFIGIILGCILMFLLIGMFSAFC